MLVPNLDIVLSVCFFAPSPIDIMEMTEATPMIIPSVVKKVLNLLAIRLRSAILNKSQISMRIPGLKSCRLKYVRLSFEEFYEYAQLLPFHGLLRLL